MDANDCIDPTETYAAAALFTLALYSSQVSTLLKRVTWSEAALEGRSRLAWIGFKKTKTGTTVLQPGDEVLFGENVCAEDLTHFWGWDCCGPDGLCQSVYRNLSIPQKSWTGLLKVAETVGDVSTDQGIEDLIHVVERYSRMLDPELCYTKGQAVELFSAQRQRSIDVGELAMVAAGCVPELEETEPESHPKAHKQASPGAKLPGITEATGSDASFDEVPLLDTDDGADPPKSQDSSRDGTSTWAEAFSAPPVGSEAPRKPTGVSAFADVNAVPSDKNPPPPAAELSGSDSEEDVVYAKYVESLKQAEDVTVMEETEDVVIPKAGFAPRNDYLHPASGKSCLALRAAVKAALLEDVFIPKEKDEEQTLRVCIQWYDARCRIALMRMAHWLRIPRSTMSAFEAEAAFHHLKLKYDESLNKKSTSITRWLKISAMAVGGGAAVAFTGGLAAPAVAAGLGAAVTLAGGGAAAASAVTGFAASTAGTATITTAFGAFGAHSTGSTMYKRTNDVKEFAFWDLSMDWTTEIEKKKMRAASAKSRFWPWKKSATQRGSRSMSEIPPAPSDMQKRLEGYVQLEDGPTEPDSPESIPSADVEEVHPVEQPARTVEVVPGLEVDLDDLEVTKSTSNYTEWWEAMVRAKERPDLLTLPINTQGDNSNLALTIAVSGVINNDKHFIDPWKRLPRNGCDRFAVVWETQLLKKVSDALVGLITSQVANEAAKWFIKKYLYTGLLSAVAFPVLITTLVDVTVGNNWALAMDRSLKAGELLAQYFIQGLHGDRPVTLIGYSLGARCIFRCLLTLYNAGKRGIIENVILLGAPVSLTDYKWARARSVVAGRFVNGYSSRDWVLGIIFRIGRGVLQNVAGISPVGLPGVENVDLSSIVSGQTEYAVCMKDIIAALNLST